MPLIPYNLSPVNSYYSQVEILYNVAGIPHADLVEPWTVRLGPERDAIAEQLEAGTNLLATRFRSTYQLIPWRDG